MIEDIKDITSFKWGTVTGIAPLAVQLDGDTAPLALVPDSLVDPALLVPGDRVRVELTQRKAVVHGRSSGSGYRGTTAQRDARFGTPSTDPERVALANRKVIWFNTDFGWEESYYAVTGLSGLTARALDSGVASGWYPTGAGPKIVLNPTAQFNATAGADIGGWNGTTWRHGGASFLTGASTGVTVNLSGRYNVRINSATQTGSGSLDTHTYIGSTFKNHSWDLNASLFRNQQISFENQPITAGEAIRVRVWAGACAVHMSSSSRRGEFMVEYLGPRLVSA